MSDANIPQNPLFDRALVWLRRDLRLDDQAALYHACRQARQVWCAFIFDTDILQGLGRQDRRLGFIRDSLLQLDEQLHHRGQQQGKAGVRLVIGHGRAVREICRLAKSLGVQAVFTNRDYEPSAVARDSEARAHLGAQGVAFYLSKDQVIFDTDEIVALSGRAYSVFTPYKNAWLKKLRDFDLRAYPCERYATALADLPARLERPIPSIVELGFEPAPAPLKLAPGPAGAQELFADFLRRIEHYDQARDFPALKGPSYLSSHLRFGLISPRQLARAAWQRAQGGSQGAKTWLNELIWRDFYHQILHHHPRVVEHCFRPEYDALHWEHGAHAQDLFNRWCHGQTGYPLVDAAMRQLNESGYMHNRLRMVTASFLVKDLGLDWRWGEAYFAGQLNDFDLAANNGGWQWAASTGCDAQPYFRIFNPISQSEKFDPQGKFIKRYLPVLAGLGERHIHAPWLAPDTVLSAAGIRLGEHYPRPIVDHQAARNRTLLRFAAAKNPR